MDTPRYATLGDTFISTTTTEALPNPQLVAWSSDAAVLVGKPETPDNLTIQPFSGLTSSPCYSAVYAGHQFGYYVPQLGDGRAHTIGEVNGWEIQLKGSGKTPYSRFGDGKAVLRSCIREFLCSEAMAALGIPTTRALCVIGSDEPVMRERVETAAILTRLAPSHIRFGTFEYAYYNHDYDALRQLADFCLTHYFAECNAHSSPYAAMLTEICTRTAKLMAAWQCVGFAHGVMNTDNMSVLGLTLDYGPFGFQDTFNAHYICNHSDENGRYAFDQQPMVALWNLNALARALSPLIEMDDIKTALQHYEPVFIEQYEAGMRAKLGLKTKHPEDGEIIRKTIAFLHANRIDYTLFFRLLSNNDFQAVSALFANDSLPAFTQWQRLYTERLANETQSATSRYAAMQRVNPKYILRNYLAENAIRTAENGDFSEVQNLHRILRQPFDEHPENAHYAAIPPDWAADICISCSS